MGKTYIIRCGKFLHPAQYAAGAAIAPYELRVLPTNHFRFTIVSRGLNSNGTYQESIATQEWFDKVEYSSGFVGGPSPNQYVYQATYDADRYRWWIEIPSQEETHDNNLYNTLVIYERKL